MDTDFETCYRAVASRDARFDGRFFTGVTSTGIYCRPVCPARLPARRNVRFFEHAAAAEEAGFRPCRRCRPEVSPDSPAWDVRQDLVGRALRLIAEGLVDTHGIDGLAARLAVSRRHLQRMFVDEVGVAPLAVARSRRARLARQLLDTSGLTVTEVAFAAGFASVRAFNDTMRAIYGASPTALRNGSRSAPGELRLRLTSRPPYAARDVLRYLAARAIPGVEHVDGATYRRTVRTSDGVALLSLRLDADTGVADLRLDGEPSGVAAVVQRARRMLDLDADPGAIGAVLSSDALLAPLVARAPGLRLPGAFDPFELAVRAVLGQQVSVAAATTISGRLVERLGEPITEPAVGLTHVFPSPDAVARADLDGLGVPAARAAAVRALSAAVVAGDVVLDGSRDPDGVVAALTALPGIGPWTACYIAMRALRDPDAFPASDLGLRRALERVGVDASPRAVAARAEGWRPWRAYAVVHLWRSLSRAERKA